MLALLGNRIRNAGVVGLSLALGTSSAPVISTALAPVPVSPSRPMVGINVSGSVYYGTERTFANLAYASGGWEAAAKDASGYPTVAGRLFLNVPQTVWSGVDTVVTCTWKGGGSMRIDGDRVSDSYGDHSVTVTWRGHAATNSYNPSMFLNYAPGAASDPLRDLDCREPGLAVVGQFDARLIDDLKPFNVLRFLDQSAANWNPASLTWATRTTPDRLAQDGNDGIALENMIDQANAVGADAWFTIPWNADADYIQRAGKLIHDRLKGRAYVELSNEVWNFQFGQTTQALNEGLAEGLSTDKYTNHLYRLAEKTIWMNKILTPIFSDDPARLVRVIAAQHANPWAGEQVMSFKDVAQWVDAFATAPYFGHSFFDGANAGVTDLPTLFASLETMRQETIKQAIANKATADKYGKRYIAYEGGQHILATDKNRDGPIITQMQRSPLMYDAYKRYLADITKVTDQVQLYSATGSISNYGSWGIREYAGQPLAETPKRRAVLEFVK
jgi:hypothetical protein